MRLSMKVPREIIELINREERFTVVSHINPEGDALGSAIALAVALDSIGKDVVVFNRDGIPSLYSFLPLSGLVVTGLSDERLKESVTVILDCNSLDRAGLEDAPVSKSVIIDHHVTENNFGDLRWIEPSAPATGVMIYHLIKELNVGFTPEIATNLYTAIAIDTGTFRFENTTSESLRIAADLVDAGARPGSISISLYESWPRERFNLLVRMLNTLELRDLTRDSGAGIGGKDRDTITVAITTITHSMFRETGTDSSNTENFSNFPRMISDVDISVMLREFEPGKWKASLRSKGDVNVAEVAFRLGGGGHKNAAGFKLEGDIDDVKKRFLATAKKALLDDN
ncbi:bifunctional oligoribonuclease and PAP phosphatase NrnA [bacterium BMS3Bbin06]|nr:bifunctional oligoribonuclease and PAP phosphatase NrnA [bacterium BMS3Abin08]GBE33673.1 bifunctional oligoribonuclease and PAP phosphatase NrnA [bacterium BMS3Bbin06]HDO36214.1 bifunctional oligoribonuclease/PAP phosphatase NrnA [Nitrospirota bacterium]HDY72019.1 bifunctional oligoribonuclease/PAP phosphatase NrnA [Nitrospirota bacterium]